MSGKDGSAAGTRCRAFLIPLNVFLFTEPEAALQLGMRRGLAGRGPLVHRARGMQLGRRVSVGVTPQQRVRWAAAVVSGLAARITGVQHSLRDRPRRPSARPARISHHPWRKRAAKASSSPGRPRHSDSLLRRATRHPRRLTIPANLQRALPLADLPAACEGARICLVAAAESATRLPAGGNPVAAAAPA